MAVNLSPVGGVAAQFFTNTGAVLTGGKLYTYAAGTTTPATTFTSSNGLTPWTNPIVLDAAGRVPSGGEIWLTDGISYKFILRDSNDVLIGTYDNITGINSNSVSFTNQQQIITATANQTVFNLSISYQPATNSLSVFVDGVNQYGPGAQYAYLETDSDTVTFVNGLHVGAQVKFTTTQQQGAGAVNASQVSYTPPGAGAVITNVQAKLRQYISVTDFGATGDGVTDDTAAIKAAVAYGLSAKSTGPGSLNNGQTIFFPYGKYRISDVIEVYEGCNLCGEQSGLVNAGAGFSTGTILILSDTKPNGSNWTTTTLVGGNTIAKRVMFTLSGGGPISMQSFGAITQGNNSVDSIFLLSGNNFAVPYENIGVTQGRFSGLRVFAFEAVFQGSRFQDVTIENCGFEYNRAVFAPVAGTLGGNYGFSSINSVATNYFANFYALISPVGTTFTDSNFSSCIFGLADSSSFSLVTGSGGQMSNVHFASCDFVPGTSSTGFYFTNTGTDFLMQGCTFTSCRFKSNGAFQFSYVATTGRFFRRNVIVGCVFENSNITLNIEDQYNTINSNVFWGTSVVTTEQSNDLVMNSNNFANCSVNPPIVLNGVPTGISISNNVFASGVTSIPVNITSTRIKMLGNVYFADVLQP
jgi:hypothetical protein